MGWEPQDAVLPWAIGDGSWVCSENDSPSKEPASQPRMPCPNPAAGAGYTFCMISYIANAGVSPVLKVLYVPDYISSQQRVLLTSKLYTTLSKAWPTYEVPHAVAELTFED